MSRVPAIRVVWPIAELKAKRKQGWWLILRNGQQMWGEMTKLRFRERQVANGFVRVCRELEKHG